LTLTTKNCKTRSAQSLSRYNAPFFRWRCARFRLGRGLAFLVCASPPRFLSRGVVARLAVFPAPFFFCWLLASPARVRCLPPARRGLSGARRRGSWTRTVTDHSSPSIQRRHFSHEREAQGLGSYSGSSHGGSL
jgi:hypothetical protein